MVPGSVGAGGWVGSGGGTTAVQQGLLWQYVGSVDPYRCPSDAKGQVYRSYSIQSYLNSNDWASIKSIHYLREVKRPASTFNFIEEEDPQTGYGGFNAGSFVMYNSGSQWVDYPCPRHQGGSCLSFCDGHVEYWKWADPRTLTLSHYVQTPNNPDLARLEAAAGF